MSRITDRVLEEMAEWAVRPLDKMYAAVFIDAIVVKVRDGQVANRPIYAAIGVSLDGERDILGLWAGAGGEGAKFWMSVLTDLRNRGVRDVFFVVCDGLKVHVVATCGPGACQVVCVSGLGHGCSDVRVDAVGVDEGELLEGLFPVRGDLAFDESAGCLSLGGG